MGFAREDFPRRGIYRIIMDDYVVDYRIKDDFLEILGIRHGHQAETDQPLDGNSDFEA